MNKKLYFAWSIMHTLENYVCLLIMYVFYHLKQCSIKLKLKLIFFMVSSGPFSVFVRLATPYGQRRDEMWTLFGQHLAF